MMKATIRIRTNEIPALETKVLAQTFLAAVNAFYGNPQNVLKFEEWQRKRNIITQNSRR